MPFTNRQIQTLLDPGLFTKGRVQHLGYTITESYLKRRVFALEDRAVKAQWALYKAAYADLRTTAHNLADGLQMSKLGRTRTSMAWRDAFLSSATQRLQQLADDSAAVGLRNATAAYLGSYYGKAWQMDVNTVEGWRPQMQVVDGLYTALDVTVREDVYDDAIRSLLGAEWRNTYRAQLDDLVLRIRGAIVSGMDAGEGIDDIMRRVRDVMGISTNRSQGYRANFNRVQTITRTLVNQISNDATAAIYRLNSDVMTHYEWLTAHDERVCPVCKSLDKTIYQISDSFRPPAHPNCRCTTIPVIDPSLLNAPDGTPRYTMPEWLALMGILSVLDDFLAPRELETERIGDG